MYIRNLKLASAQVCHIVISFMQGKIRKKNGYAHYIEYSTLSLKIYRKYNCQCWPSFEYTSGFYNASTGHEDINVYITNVSLEFG